MRVCLSFCRVVCLDGCMRTDGSVDISGTGETGNIFTHSQLNGIEDQNDKVKMLSIHSNIFKRK